MLAVTQQSWAGAEHVDAPQAIVLPCGRAVDCELRDGEIALTVVGETA